MENSVRVYRVARRAAQPDFGNAEMLLQMTFEFRKRLFKKPEISGNFLESNVNTDFSGSADSALTDHDPDNLVVF